MTNRAKYRLREGMDRAILLLDRTLQERSTLDLAMVLRWFIALVALFQYGALPFIIRPTHPKWYWATAISILYFLYTLVVSVADRNLQFRKRHQANYSGVVPIEFFIDTLACWALYVFIWTPSSNTYLFYVLPLLIAASHRKPRRSMLLFTLIVASFLASYIPIAVMYGKNYQDFPIQFFTAALPRSLFFMFATFTAFFFLREIGKKKSQLDATHRTAGKIAAGEDLESRLEAIMEATKELLDVPGCIIYLPEGHCLRLVAMTGMEPGPLRVGYELPVDASTANRVHRTRTPLTTEDYPNHPDSVPELRHLFQSVAQVPIIFSDEALGVLTAFTSTSKRFFGPDHLSTLEYLAVHAAVAIHDSQLLERESRQRACLEVLNKAGQEINKNLRLSDATRFAAEYAFRITSLHAEAPLRTRIWLTEDGKYLHLEATHPPRAQDDSGCQLKAKVGKSGYSEVIKRSMTEREIEVMTLPRDHRTYCPFDDRAATLAVVPLVGASSTEALGVLTVEHASEDPFGPDLGGQFQTLASQAASAISNALLNERLLKLNEGGIQINGVHELDEVADQILAQLRIMFDYDRATLQLVDEDGTRRTIARKGTFSQGQSLNIENTKVSDDALVYSILERDEARIGRPEDLQGWEFLESTSDVKFWAGVPLKYRGKPVGFIAADRLKDHVPWENQQRFLSIFGRYAASSLAGSLLLRQLEQKVSELETLGDTLADQTNLALIGLVYGETIHFARAKLGMARVIATDIAEGFYDLDMERLKGGANRINVLLDDYLKAIKKIQAEAIEIPKVVSTNVHHLLENCLGAKRVAKKDVVIVRHFTAPRPVVRAPQHQLRQVFLVIIENALDAMRGRSNSRLTLETRLLMGSGDEEIEIGITDNGRGMTEGQVRSLFKAKLDDPQDPQDGQRQKVAGRGRVRKGRKGGGIGLVWAYAFVRSYGGDITCQSEVDTGTTITVRIPREFLDPSVIEGEDRVEVGEAEYHGVN